MTYTQLVARVAYLSGYPKCVVRAILAKVPDALMEIPEGEHVRTPLGVFRMVRKPRRKVNLPGTSKKGALLRERLQMRLDAGGKLKKVVKAAKKAVT